MLIGYSFGDVFESEFEGRLRYFQLAARDLYQLNSDVIAVFAGEYRTPQTLEHLSSSGVDYFGHTSVGVGVPELWRKVGTMGLVSTEKALFKGVDFEKEDEFKQPFEGPSNHWKVWDLKDKHRYIGPHENVPIEAELGLVFNPESAHYRMFHGEYDFENGYYGVNK